MVDEVTFGPGTEVSKNLTPNNSIILTNLFNINLSKCRIISIYACDQWKEVNLVYKLHLFKFHVFGTTYMKNKFFGKIEVSFSCPCWHQNLLCVQFLFLECFKGLVLLVWLNIYMGLKYIYSVRYGDKTISWKIRIWIQQVYLLNTLFIYFMHIFFICF